MTARDVTKWDGTGQGQRETLAEALRKAWIKGAPFVVNEAEGAVTRMDFGRYADALLPVVQRLCDQRAVEALEDAARTCEYVPLSERSAHEGGLSDFTKGWHAAGQHLRDRAAAVRDGRQP